MHLRNRSMALQLVASTIFFAAPPAGIAQEPRPAVDRVIPGPLRVFLECPGEESVCDFDHIRREIRFVVFVREPQDAQVHVLVTSQRSGGGSLYALNFIGRSEFDAVRDVLRYASSGTDTEDERRAGLTRTLELGLVRYAAETSEAERLEVSYRDPVLDPAQQALRDLPDLIPEREEDPWNFWVFRIGLNGSFSEEESTGAVSLRTNFSADRTTEAWKFNLQASTQYGESTFDLDESTSIISINRQFGSTALLVRALGDHLSTGLQGSVRSTTFGNTNLSLRTAPAFEYSVFSYEESARRQIRFLYSVGLVSFDYEEETIFDKTEETRWDQSLSVSLSFTQAWGSANVTLAGSQFLDDPDQNLLTLLGFGDIRLVRGLSLSLFGSISHVANQLNLPKGGATEEEILLRRKELATSFRVSGSVGFSYAFGSIFSSIVNPRFGG